MSSMSFHFLITKGPIKRNVISLSLLRLSYGRMILHNISNNEYILQARGVSVRISGKYKGFWLSTAESTELVNL